jgi:hypothetical protein
MHWRRNVCTRWWLFTWTLWSSACSVEGLHDTRVVVGRSESDRSVQRLRRPQKRSTAIDNDTLVSDYIVYLDPHVIQRGNGTLDDVAMQVARQFSGQIVYIYRTLFVGVALRGILPTTTAAAAALSSMANHRAGILRIELVRVDTQHVHDLCMYA